MCITRTFPVRAIPSSSILHMLEADCMPRRVASYSPLTSKFLSLWYWVVVKFPTIPGGKKKTWTISAEDPMDDSVDSGQVEAKDARKWYSKQQLKLTL